MSQYWHAHWANESFKPHRLCNWEVTNWHPCWPDAHCGNTIFECDDKGHILAGRAKSVHSPWGNFKGTWELPLKINRNCARELSAFPEYKKNAWSAHQARNRALCKGLGYAVRTKKVEPADESDIVADLNNSRDLEPESKVSETKMADRKPELVCSLHHICRV